MALADGLIGVERVVVDLADVLDAAVLQNTSNQIPRESGSILGVFGHTSLNK